MVKSARRTIQILQAVGESRHGMKNIELSSKLNILKGSLSPILSELVSSDFLIRRNEDNRYVLGPKIIMLAGKYLSGLDLVQFGRPIVHELMMTTNESSAIAVGKGPEILIVYGENCSQPLRRTVEIGYRAPMHTTAAGKAILAYLPEEKFKKYLASADMTRVTPLTITSAEGLKKQLMEIRAKGLAYAREEQFAGLTAVAAPVFDMHSNVEAALVVTVPTIRFKDRLAKLIEEALRNASETLSRQLGYNPPQSLK